MSHAASTVSVDDVQKIVTAKPIEIPVFLRTLFMIFMFLGVLTFLKGVANEHSRHTWLVFHVNFLYWFCVAAASCGFAAVFHICNAQWSRPVRRIFDSALPFLTISPIFLVILYFGHKELFVWAHHEIPGKGIWLTSNFLFFRDAVAIALLVWITRKVVMLSLKRDIIAIRKGLTGCSSEDTEAWQDSRYDALLCDCGDDASKALSRVEHLMSRFSPVVVMVYALATSLIAFDLIMSIEPMWYSTLFGALYFMSAVYLSVAFAAIGVCGARYLSPLLRQKVDRKVLHDLGKLLFGFGIFWAYMFWSHYLPMWYSNLPEETVWIITRLREQPWQSFAWVVLCLCFFIPFALGLSRDVKQVPGLLAGTAMFVCIGLWLQMYLLVAPTLYPEYIPFGATEICMSLGFLGLYGYLAFHHIKHVPLIPFGDFYLKK